MRVHSMYMLTFDDNGCDFIFAILNTSKFFISLTTHLSSVLFLLIFHRLMSAMPLNLLAYSFKIL